MTMALLIQRDKEEKKFKIYELKRRKLNTKFAENAHIKHTKQQMPTSKKTHSQASSTCARHIKKKTLEKRVM